MRIVLSAFILAGTISSANSETYYGQFTHELVGQFVQVNGDTRFRTQEPFGFLDPNGLQWDVPRQTITDGASIPWPFWPVIGHPMGGGYLWAAVVHDHYCDAKTRTSESTHRTFYYAMKTLGVEPWKADLMFWAVSTFGPKWILETQFTQRQDCEIVNGQRVCQIVPVFEQVAVLAPSVDFSNPEISALAQAKFAAIAKTLKTSGGDILDISSVGQVSSGLEQIEQSAYGYRTMLMMDPANLDPAAFGILTEFDGTVSIDQIPVWEDNVLPNLQNAPDWNLELQRNDWQSGFVLDRSNLDSISDLYAPELFRPYEIVIPDAERLRTLESLEMLEQFQSLQ